MEYRVTYKPQAKKQLRKIDKAHRNRIKSWIENTVDGCSNPRQWGDSLTGNFAGLWRYRVGQYRIVVQIQDDELIILVVTVGHRGKVYQNH